MIKIGMDLAILNRHVISEGGEYLGAKLKGDNFLAYETELPLASERNVIAGTTSTVSDVTLALATSDNIAATIVSDDTVAWKGRTYSVSNVSARRKKGGMLFSKEYVVYLKG